MHLNRIIMAATLSTLLFAVPGAFAQEDGQSSPGMQKNAPAEVDEATIDKFADAMGKVQVIQQSVSQQLQAVENDDQARELQLQAQDEMIAAVKETGLTVEEYNNLAERAQQNPQLRQQVMEKLENR